MARASSQGIGGGGGVVERRFDVIGDQRGDPVRAPGKYGRPLKYSAASEAVRDVRHAIGAQECDIHGLRYSATAELAAAGYSDELIAAITGHKTTVIMVKYAGPARRKARAKKAQGLCGTNAVRIKNVANSVKKSDDSKSRNVWNCQNTQWKERGRGGRTRTGTHR